MKNSVPFKDETHEALTITIEEGVKANLELFAEL